MGERLDAATGKIFGRHAELNGDPVSNGCAPLGITKNNKPKHHMKNIIIKALAAVILMAGITSTHAAEKSLGDRVKEAVKEINKDHGKKQPSNVSNAVRG